MSLSHISRASLQKLLILAERKEELILLVGEIEAVMLDVIAAESGVATAAPSAPAKAEKPAKKAKRKVSAASRAKMAAAAKARWADRKAVESPETSEPAKKVSTSPKPE